MKISIITLFPEVFEPILNSSILKRAQQKNLVEFELIDHRDFGIGTHKVIDDKPYGGGVGMVMRVDVLASAIDHAKKSNPEAKVILLDAQGEVYKQETAESLTGQNLILVCGHYEGFDERVTALVDRKISIGDYILTGGEIPAMVLVDSLTRLIPGVLKDETATKTESHSEIDGKRILEGPHYTRPEEFNGQKVPEVLLSGDPKKIEVFKKEKALEITLKTRPDLITKP